MIEVNGMAHVILTVSSFERALGFYGQLLPFLGLALVFRGENFAYWGKVAAPRSASSAARQSTRAARFVQNRVGLHHLCLRARTREDVDKVGRKAAQHGRRHRPRTVGGRLGAGLLLPRLRGSRRHPAAR